jgi:hypothetical protein
MHLKLLEKQEQTKPKTSRWREIIKIRAKINDIKTKQTIQRINKTKSWVFLKDLQDQQTFSQHDKREEGEDTN